MRKTGPCILVKLILKRNVLKFPIFKPQLFFIITWKFHFQGKRFWVHLHSISFASWSLWLGFIKRLYIRSTLKHFKKTSTWSLLIYVQLTISYKKVLFHFYYNNVKLHVVILRLAYSYWMVYCDLVKTIQCQINAPSHTHTQTRLLIFEIFLGPHFFY